MNRNKYNILYSNLNYMAKNIKSDYPEIENEEPLKLFNKLTDIFKSTAKIRNLYSDDDIEYAVFNSVISYYWNRYKIVYTLNEDFYEVLTDSEDITIDNKIFNRLPFNSFMIKTPNSKIYSMELGDIIWIKTYDHGTEIFISTISDVKNKKIKSLNNVLFIPNNTSFYKAIEEKFDKEQLEDDEFRKLLTNTFKFQFKFVINFALYLCAQNSVIKEIKISKKDRPIAENGDKLNIKQWDVGYRIIKSPYPIIEDESESTDISIERHNSPRPHMRRAHWHHYWVGKGRTDLVLKWIEPVWVMGTSEDMIPTENI